MISIIIPVYNQAAKIKATLDSIFNQTYQDFEIIVVNDGSTDDLEEALKPYQDKIKYLKQENKGAPAARNAGWRASRGEFLFFCDADAVLVLDALDVLSATLNKYKNFSYAYPSFMWGKKLFKVGPFMIERLRHGPFIHTMALIRRNDFPIDGWDESIKRLQDWDLWLTMLEKNHTGIWVDRILFHISPGGKISDWLPSFFYKLFPFLPSVKKYESAVAVVKKKHKLP